MQKTPNKDVIAIYSRKSRFTGKGESVGNQVELCRSYIRSAYGDSCADSAVVYEDEGFSGGNLNRPGFKQMMKAARIEELNRLGIDFISIRESFDTSSPMGRAMMYIASVFSQLERETIAERIRDNMHELAKTGRWLGGTTPTGYTSEAVKTVTVDGKSKRATDPRRSRHRPHHLRPLPSDRFPHQHRGGTAAPPHPDQDRALLHSLFHQDHSAKSGLSHRRPGCLAIFHGQAGGIVLPSRRI